MSEEKDYYQKEVARLEKLIEKLTLQVNALLPRNSLVDSKGSMIKKRCIVCSKYEEGNCRELGFLVSSNVRVRWFDAKTYFCKEFNLEESKN